MLTHPQKYYSNAPPFNALKIYALFIVILFIFHLCPPILSAQESQQKLQDSYVKLKEDFERSLKRNNDQKVRMIWAMRAVSLSWALACEQSAKSSDVASYTKESIEKFEERWRKNSKWDARDLLCLEFQQQNLEFFAINLLKNNEELKPELDKIINQTKMDLAKIKKDDTMERKLVLSTSLVGINGVLIKLIGGKTTGKDLNLIMQAAVDRANNINSRKDVHYRGKMNLLYASNIQTITSLNFYMAHIADDDLKKKMTEAHRQWVSQMEQNPPLPDALSLTWVAQAQVVLPLSYRISTLYRAN